MCTFASWAVQVPVKSTTVAAEVASTTLQNTRLVVLLLISAPGDAASQAYDEMV